MRSGFILNGRIARLPNLQNENCDDDSEKESWLNMVEIEIGVLKRQCLDRRIDDREELEREIAAWERQLNLAGAHLKWMFTTEKARTKMGRAYPRPAATLDQPAKKS